MIQRFLSALAALAVAGCVGAPVNCTSPATREIRTIDRLIAETRRDIDRGYTTRRIESGASLNLCLGGADDGVGVSFCTDGASRRAVAIDREAEGRKLDNLLARREALVRQQSRDLAACRGEAS